jgi:hypothetical protein
LRCDENVALEDLEPLAEPVAAQVSPGS